MDELTLRDYFAAKALQGLLHNEELDYDNPGLDVEEQVGLIAMDAYRLADAMLQARQSKGNN